MTKQRNDPRISVNKLAQYVTSRAARQSQILQLAKYPPEYITTYYREASEAIARYLASGMTDVAILDGAVNVLNQIIPSTVYETRRIAGNIDAIETFATLLDEIDFEGATAQLGTQKAPHLVMQGVHISVRPEVTLHSIAKSNSLVGGIKLHFPVTEPLDAEQAGYVSAVVQAFCSAHLWKDGTPFGNHCMVIDMASKKVYPGVKAIIKRMKDINSACDHIAALWPSISPP
jgi:hypothetical protein